MADFDLAIVKTLIHEGGSKVTDDPVDRGGLTKFGISQLAYPDLDIKSLTEDDAKALYKKDYWDRVKGDYIHSQQMAEAIFDTAVNMGVRTSGRLTQLAAEVEPVDGIIGQKTVATVNKKDEELFLAKFAIVKIARYAHICSKNSSQKKYLLGWINRTLGEV